MIMANQTSSSQGPNGRFPLSNFELILGLLGLAALIVAGLLLWNLFASSRGTAPAPTPVAQATLPLIVPTSADPLRTAEPTADMTMVATVTAVVPTTLPPTDAPTQSPLPTAILSSPTPTCAHDLRFVADVTIPDDSIIPPGVGFTKVWRVQNSGNCLWPAGSAWFLSSGHPMGGPNLSPVPVTTPGQTADISVNLVAPTTPGQYTGYYALRLPDGQVVDRRLYVRIIVPAPTPIPLPATATPTATTIPVISPTPTATQPPVILNWRGEYFSNTSLSGAPALVRDDPAIQFNWGEGPPAPGLPADNFSVRWTRTLNFPVGDYRFSVLSDDGVRVWVNNQLIIDSWQAATGQTQQVNMALAAGNHTIRVEYFEQWGIAQIQFSWSRIENFAEWRGEYWPNASLSGQSALLRNDREINFNWGENAPPNLPADNFSARWTRRMRLEEGNYRFFARMDDGMRVYLNNQLILNEWRDGSDREVTVDQWLVAGDYDLRVEYYERSGNARASFRWQRTAGFPEWRGEYWDNKDLRGTPVLVRNDRVINFDWGFGSPAPQVPTDQFSARWTRQFNLPQGVHRLYARADDGIRIYVDGELVLDRWFDSSGDRVHQIDVKTGGLHTIVVEYYDNLHTARVRFWMEQLYLNRPG
jgi:hypothetical protein